MVKFNFSRAFSLTAIAVGLGLAAIPASAQQAAFHLPFEAHWGAAVLEPGDYKLSVQAAQSPSHIIYLSGARKTSMVLPETAGSPAVLSKDGSIKLVSVNGEYFVREYTSPSTGQVFVFSVPKAALQVLTASNHSTSIPVDELHK